ncbi:MAG: lysozyme inhibitor LprI family protein, partial [Clostridium sp.]
KKLETEQIQWIKDKEPKAKESAKKFEGGTQYEVEYAMTLGQLTKERCNYLVNNYMK